MTILLVIARAVVSAALYVTFWVATAADWSAIRLAGLQKNLTKALEERAAL